MQTPCDVANNVFNSLLTPNVIMLFMRLFLVIILKNADGITPKMVQQRQFCRGQGDAFQASVFQLLWRDPGIVLGNLVEWMNCLSFKQSSLNSVISQQGF